MSTLADVLLPAVYGQLAPDPGLAGLGVTVHDEPPETAVPPYVLLGELDEVPDEAHDRTGVEAVLTVHVWSRYRGYREAALIVTRVDELLHRQPLALPGWQKVYVTARRHRFMRDSDPDLRHAMATFRIRAERAPIPPIDEE